MTNLSLRRGTLIGAALLLIALVIASTHIAQQLIWRGELNAQQLLMVTAARQSENQLQQHPQTQLLDSDNLKVFVGWQSLPQQLQAISGGQPPAQLQTMIKNPTSDPRIGALLRYPQQQGDDIYVHLRFDPDLLIQQRPADWQPLLALNLMVISLIVLATYFMLRHVITPINQLSSQLRQLQWDQLGDKPPRKLRYRELQTVYQALLDSIAKLRQQQQREAQLLSYASHELRTPIAVSLSAFELMEKQQGRLTPVQQRAQRANQQMQQISETVLWLGHQQLEQLPQQRVDLQQLLTNTIAELDDNSKVQFSGEPYPMHLPLLPLQILLRNLIRNANQHGQGVIQIQQQAGTISISNVPNAEQQRGFGLGLMLVKRLSQQFGWHYQVRQNDQCQPPQHQVILQLEQPYE